LVIFDGVTATASSYHTGDGTVQDLTVTHPIDSGATELTVILQVNTVNGDVDFGGVIAAFSDLAPSHWSPFTGVQIASAVSPGLWSIGTQELPGDKTLTGAITFSGAVSFTGAVGVLDVNTTSVGNVGGGTDDLISYSLPANTLGVNGRGVRITAWGTWNDTTSAGTLQVLLKFGATTLNPTAALAAGSTGTWKFVAEVIRTGAATQVGTCGAFWGTSATPPQTAANSAPGETLSGAVVIKCQAVAGVNNNDVVNTGMIVEAI
jgi:hypothetical protein